MRPTTLAIGLTAILPLVAGLSPVVASDQCDAPFVPPARTPQFCVTWTPQQVEACKQQADQNYSQQISSARQEWERERIACHARVERDRAQRAAAAEQAAQEAAQQKAEAERNRFIAEQQAKEAAIRAQQRRAEVEQQRLEAEKSRLISEEKAREAAAQLALARAEAERVRLEAEKAKNERREKSLADCGTKMVVTSGPWTSWFSSKYSTAVHELASKLISSHAFLCIKAMDYVGAESSPSGKSAARVRITGYDDNEYQQRSELRDVLY